MVGSGDPKLVDQYFEILGYVGYIGAQYQAWAELETWYVCNIHVSIVHNFQFLVTNKSIFIFNTL